MEDNSKKQNATFLGEVRPSIVKIIYPDGSKNVTYFRGTENGIEDIDGPLEPDPCDLARDYEEMQYGSDAPTEYDPS